MKAWITKYALTKGIEEVNGNAVTKGVFEVKDEKFGSFYQYFNGNDWHETKEDAVCHAEEMRDRAIASLEKKLKKLKSMKFES